MLCDVMLTLGDEFLANEKSGSRGVFEKGADQKNREGNGVGGGAEMGVNDGGWIFLNRRGII